MTSSPRRPSLTVPVPALSSQPPPPPHATAPALNPHERKHPAMTAELHEETSWPGDPVAVATAAAEAIRRLNHATRPPGTLTAPAQAYEVLGALATAAARTSQAIAQITSYLNDAVSAGKLGHDLGDDPCLAVDAAATLLAAAQQKAAELASRLGTAQQQIARIHARATAATE